MLGGDGGDELGVVVVGVGGGSLDGVVDGDKADGLNLGLIVGEGHRVSVDGEVGGVENGILIVEDEGAGVLLVAVRPVDEVVVLDGSGFESHGLAVGQFLAVDVLAVDGHIAPEVVVVGNRNGVVLVVVDGKDLAGLAGEDIDAGAVDIGVDIIDIEGGGLFIDSSEVDIVTVGVDPLHEVVAVVLGGGEGDILKVVDSLGAGDATHHAIVGGDGTLNLELIFLEVGIDVGVLSENHRELDLIAIGVGPVVEQVAVDVVGGEFGVDLGQVGEFEAGVIVGDVSVTADEALLVGVDINIDGEGQRVDGSGEDGVLGHFEGEGVLGGVGVLGASDTDGEVLGFVGTLADDLHVSHVKGLEPSYD